MIVVSAMSFLSVNFFKKTDDCSVCYVFPQCKQLNAMKSTKRNVALRIFACFHLMFQLMVKICEVVEPFV